MVGRFGGPFLASRWLGELGEGMNEGCDLLVLLSQDLPSQFAIVSLG